MIKYTIHAGRRANNTLFVFAGTEVHYYKSLKRDEVVGGMPQHLAVVR